MYSQMEKRERESDDESELKPSKIQKVKDTKDLMQLLENKTAKELTTISIIGSSGRKQDANRVTKELWKNMINRAETLIEDLGLKWQNICIVSGGAAFADHISVALHRKYGVGLKLCLPSRWDFQKHCFRDLRLSDWKANPGATLNFYHQSFSEKVGIKSLEELHEILINKKSEISYSNGFFDRNDEVSKSQIMIAFSFGRPCSGGTGYTWKKSKAIKKLHVSLELLQDQ